MSIISKLKIENFKCFKEPVEFEFSKLNLLTGVNGRGKSTLLQAMLVIGQSDDIFSRKKKISLNSKYVSLGNFEDVKNSETLMSAKVKISFSFEKLIDEAIIVFSENDKDSMSAQVESAVVSPQSNSGFDKMSSEFERVKKDFAGILPGVDTEGLIGLIENLFYGTISEIHYVSADRLGPVKYVDKSSLIDFTYVGPKGEATINILANDDLPLVSDLLYLGNDAKSVIQQTQEWLSYILDGAKIVVKGKEKDSSVLYMLMNNRKTPYNYKPTNVGFGYSYILPIIVSGLIARPGQILIVENPEAHLHPRAQSRITDFFAKVASTGVQVFIESHSEHILNGLRVNSLNPEIPLKHSDLTVHYFNEDFESEKLVSDEMGKIDNWPEGFFDQQEIDLAEIFKRSRK